MNNDSLQNMRKDYHSPHLTQKDLLTSPLKQFDKWFQEAIDSNVAEPNAFCLATSNNNIPSSRIVLVKEIRDNGIVFYTNYNSDKGIAIEENPIVSANFFWQPLARQVRITGVCKKLSAEDSDAYFNKRPLKSRIGAIASPQSNRIESREWLLNQWELIEQKLGEHPKRPDYWGGYLIEPTSVEFWQGQQNRFHDRFFYELVDEQWTIVRLAP